MTRATDVNFNGNALTVTGATCGKGSVVKHRDVMKTGPATYGSFEVTWEWRPAGTGNDV